MLARVLGVALALAVLVPLCGAVAEDAPKTSVFTGTLSAKVPDAPASVAAVLTVESKALDGTTSKKDYKLLADGDLAKQIAGLLDKKATVDVTAEDTAGGLKVSKVDENKVTTFSDVKPPDGFTSTKGRAGGAKAGGGRGGGGGKAGGGGKVGGAKGGGKNAKVPDAFAAKPYTGTLSPKAPDAPASVAAVLTVETKAFDGTTSKKEYKLLADGDLAKRVADFMDMKATVAVTGDDTADGLKVSKIEESRPASTTGTNKGGGAKAGGGRGGGGGGGRNKGGGGGGGAGGSGSTITPLSAP